MGSDFKVGDIVSFNEVSNKYWQGGKGKVVTLGHPYVTVSVLESVPTNELNTPVGREVEMEPRYLKLFVEAEDSVNSPAHYTQYPGIEVIQLTEHMDFCRGNAVKYLARAGHKDKTKELEDLMKARWYTDRAIEKLQVELSAI